MDQTLRAVARPRPQCLNAWQLTAYIGEQISHFENRVTESNAPPGAMMVARLAWRVARAVWFHFHSASGGTESLGRLLGKWIDSEKKLAKVIALHAFDPTSFNEYCIWPGQHWTKVIGCLTRRTAWRKWVRRIWRRESQTPGAPTGRSCGTPLRKFLIKVAACHSTLTWGEDDYVLTEAIVGVSLPGHSLCSCCCCCCC